ncbi:MAG TPA: sulfite exporter TauE/SafE family protein [Usitatibacter sp.]|nr:sulfite exporter TauE/SafE family protein [Usitatibacter sp.]
MITLTVGQLSLLCAGAMLGGAIFGVVGFAAGVIMSIFIHHAFSAPDVVFIVVGGAVVLNLGLLPRFWREIRWGEALPYLAGAFLGLPVGLWLLQHLDARTIRAAVAVLIVAYGLFALRQQSREPLRFTGAHGKAMDGSIGFTGGVIGGVSGLGPLVPGVWFGLRGLSKVEQRALTQPFGLCVQGFMVVWLVASSTVSRHAVEGLAIATPVMIAASWLGLRGFDRISTALFQKIVVFIAIGGALLLLARQLWS